MSEEPATGSQPTKVTRGGPPPEGGEPGFGGMPTGTKVGSGDRMSGGLAGLMTNIRDQNESKKDGRWNTTFTLSRHLVSDDFEAAGFEDRHLKFKIVELQPEEEDRAATNAGGGLKLTAQFSEMVKASLFAIGDSRCNYDQKTAWLKAIGPKSRKQVERCFSSVNGIEDKEGEDILATAKSGRG